MVWTIISVQSVDTSDNGKVVLGDGEAPPLPTKGLVRLDARSFQEALETRVPICVIEFDHDHCVHGRESRQIPFGDLIMTRPLDFVS